jgi:hypothetical protein
MSDQVQIIRADARLAKLANAISYAIHEAMTEGIEADAAASVAVGVAADYWLDQGYSRSVTDLAGILTAKANQRAGGGRA